jgi:hypothetical protein
MQVLRAPPAKKSERIWPRAGLKEWMHACSFTFHILISPFNPPDAKILESVREKDNAAEAKQRLRVRIMSACFDARVLGPSLYVFEEEVA